MDIKKLQEDYKKYVGNGEISNAIAAGKEICEYYKSRSSSNYKKYLKELINLCKKDRTQKQEAVYLLYEYIDYNKNRSSSEYVQSLKDVIEVCYDGRFLDQFILNSEQLSDYYKTRSSSSYVSILDNSAKRLEKLRKYREANKFLEELAAYYSPKSQSSYKRVMSRIEENKKWYK